MKNKKLAKIFIMMLIIIVGIGGACFAGNPKCVQGIHNFGIDGSDGHPFVCKDCGYICDESTSTFGDYTYKWKDGTSDNECHFRYCLNSNHDHGVAAAYAEPHIDEDGDGKCDSCSFELKKEEKCNYNNCDAALSGIWENWFNEKHYQLCEKGHQNYFENHEFEETADPYADKECKICKLTIQTYPSTDYLVNNRILDCLSCGEVIEAKWYSTEDGRHYRACKNNHHSFIGAHNFSYGKCTICLIDEKDATSGINTSQNPNINISGEIDPLYLGKKCEYNNCEGTLDGIWRRWFNERHYQLCSKGHQNYFEEHEFETTIDPYADRECKVCKLVIQTYPNTDYLVNNIILDCLSCGEVIEAKWYSTNDGRHYRACKNNHHSFIGAHSEPDGEGRCTVCRLMIDNNKVENDSNVIFSDLPESHWGYNDVMEMVEAGIVNGRGDGTLGTDDKITAEEFMALLSRSLVKKGYAQGNGNVFLADSLQSEWSYNDYTTLAKILGAKSGETDNLGATEIKLILGNSESEILENYKKAITREKAANIMGTFIESDEGSSVNILNATDWENVNSIYRKRINKLAKMNIFKGVLNSDGSINVNPTDEITRVQAITLINRLYNTL